MCPLELLVHVTHDAKRFVRVGWLVRKENGDQLRCLVDPLACHLAPAAELFDDRAYGVEPLERVGPRPVAESGAVMREIEAA